VRKYSHLPLLCVKTIERICAAYGAGLSIAQPDAKDILELTNAIIDYIFSYLDRFEQFKKRRKSACLEPR
jgi:hypothetical protein